MTGNEPRLSSKADVLRHFGSVSCPFVIAGVWAESREDKIDFLALNHSFWSSSLNQNLVRTRPIKHSACLQWQKVVKPSEAQSFPVAQAFCEGCDGKAARCPVVLFLCIYDQCNTRECSDFREMAAMYASHKRAELRMLSCILFQN